MRWSACTGFFGDLLPLSAARNFPKKCVGVATFEWVTQNVYDSPEFFGSYAALARSRHGLDGAPEWPSVRSLLPDLDGARIVDLGCGFGAFGRWAVEHGAAEVLAIDVSERMLQRARADTRDPRIRYEIADLEQLVLPPGRFDLAYSALALHYIGDLRRLVAVVYDTLEPGGQFVFTTEHPIFTAPTSPGWRQVDGNRVWPLDRYGDEGERITDWLAPGIRKQHRMIGTTLSTLIDAGFTLQRLIEWGPSPDQIAADPTLAEELDRPMFMLVAAQR